MGDGLTHVNETGRETIGCRGKAVSVKIGVPLTIEYVIERIRLAHRQVKRRAPDAIAFLDKWNPADLFVIEIADDKNLVCPQGGR